MLATRELLRREHLGKIAGKTFVIQASTEATAPYDAAACMHACMQRPPDLSSCSKVDTCSLLQSRSL